MTCKKVAIWYPSLAVALSAVAVGGTSRVNTARVSVFIPLTISSDNIYTVRYSKRIGKNLKHVNLMVRV